MDIQKLVQDGLKHNRIRELYLYQTPVLKTVNDWDRVKEIGRIYFNGKRATYKGALVMYGIKVYFVPDHTLTALSKFRKWKFPGEVEVVTEQDWKKKVTDFQKKFSKSNKDEIGHQ